MDSGSSSSTANTTRSDSSKMDPTSLLAVFESKQDIIGPYKLGKALGRGRCGTVYRAVNINTGEFVAIKQISRRFVDQVSIEQFTREVETLRNLEHPNIVLVLGNITTDVSLNLVLELADAGSVSALLDKFGSFPESLAAVYVRQILTGLQYLHSQGVLHRDIKGGNVLVSTDGVVKLADFGCASEYLADLTKRVTVVGTPYWMAPEVIEMSGSCPASDIWSVACTTLELVTTQPPFFGLPPVSAMFRIVQEERPSLPSNISPALRDFLLQCFVKDISKRPSAEQLVRHRWISAALIMAAPSFEAGTKHMGMSDARPKTRRNMDMTDLMHTVAAHTRQRAPLSLGGPMGAGSISRLFMPKDPSPPTKSSTSVAPLGNEKQESKGETSKEQDSQLLLLEDEAAALAATLEALATSPGEWSFDSSSDEENEGIETIVETEQEVIAQQKAAQAEEEAASDENLPFGVQRPSLKAPDNVKAAVSGSLLGSAGTDMNVHKRESHRGGKGLERTQTSRGRLNSVSRGWARAAAHRFASAAPMLQQQRQQREELEKKLAIVQRECDDLKRALRDRASPEKALVDFFFMLAMSLKTEVARLSKQKSPSPEEQFYARQLFGNDFDLQDLQKLSQVSFNTSVQALYDKAVEDSIPWSQWLVWLPRQIFLVNRGSHGRSTSIGEGPGQRQVALGSSSSGS